MVIHPGADFGEAAAERVKIPGGKARIAGQETDRRIAKILPRIRTDGGVGAESVQVGASVAIFAAIRVVGAAAGNSSWPGALSDFKIIAGDQQAAVISTPSCRELSDRLEAQGRI